MRRFARNERGANLVEFSILAPVFFGILGLALFLAHVYEVRSDLQRAAERTAIFGASQCDYRGAYPAGTGCGSGAAHPTEADMRIFANKEFGQNVTFNAPAPGTCDHGAGPVLCVSYDPAPPAGPVPNHRMRVRLMYEYDTPLAPFMRLIGLGNSLVRMDGRGEATVE